MSGYGRVWDYDMPTIGWNDERGHKAQDKSLVMVLAYRCHRCGYIWLPKDYDVSDTSLLDREPPKSCARCKSKSWRHHDVLRFRKSGARVIDYGDFKTIDEPGGKERVMALMRQGKYLDVARLRPEWKDWLVRHKALYKIKHEGKDYVTDGVHMIAVDKLKPKPEPEPEQAAETSK